MLKAEQLRFIRIRSKGGSKVNFETYSLPEIKSRLDKEDFPLCGMTTLGSAGFSFKEPVFYAGLAIHAGSRIRSELQDILKVGDADRYREEDPGTEQFIRDFPIQVIALDSRFEYDLNRSETRAIPLTPDMAWGLNVWKRPLTVLEMERSLEKYREFHQLLDIIAGYLIRRFERAYIFDIHSYCYQREKRLAWYEDDKPVINLGTEAINKKVFGQDIRLLLELLQLISIENRKISVAENEIFKGGYLARRLTAQYHHKLAVFAIEFKKIFMDEWIGNFYPSIYNQLIKQFSAIVDEYLEQLLK